MRKSFNRVFLLLLAITLLAACSSNKHKVLKPVKLTPIKAEIKLKTLWSHDIGTLGKYYHQFAIAISDGSVFAASADGKVYRYDKYTGKKQWKVALNTAIITGVAVDQQHVYVAAINGALIALDKAKGNQVWSQEADSEIVAPPAARDGNVVFQTSSGEVYNINAQDGQQKWRVSTNVPALTLRGNSTAIFFADFVVVGLANGRLGVFDLATGALRWDPRVALPQGESEIERIVDIDGSAVIAGENLISVSYQGKLTAFSLSQGNELWSADESSYHAPSVGMDNVYVSSADAHVNAYNQRTGDVKWSQEKLLRRKITAPTVLSSYVAVADYQGYIHLLSQIDGRFIARKKVTDSGIKTAVAADGDRFYVLANNGRLKAYQLGKSLKK